MQAEARQAIDKALSEGTAQRALIDHILAYGGAHTDRRFIRAPATAGSADAVLEVALLRADGKAWQTGTWRIVSTHYAVSLEARGRLKRLFDGLVLADRTYRYDTIPRMPQEWADNGGVRLADEIERSYGQLAEWIVDDFFLTIGEAASAQPSRAASDRVFRGASAAAPAAELPQIPLPQPLAPPFKSFPVFGGCDVCTKAGLVPVMADTLRPTLRWRFDVPALAQGLAAWYSVGETGRGGPTSPILAPTGVYYEVRLFRGETVPIGGLPRTQHVLLAGPLVYARTGLGETLHLLEEDLAPCANYLWTVRATFDLGGVTRATEWAGNYSSFQTPPGLRQAETASRLIGGMPFDRGYPFSTPCPGNAE